MEVRSDLLAFSESMVSEEEMDEMLATEIEFRRGCRRRDRSRGGGEYDPDATDDLTAFMRSHGKISPLTHAEAVDLFRRYHAGVVARSRLDDGLLGDKEARRYERLAAMGVLAREQIIIGNIPLVFALAPRRSRGGLDYPDFMQAGISGLMLAIEHYDYRMGFKFSTYAAYCIKSAFDDARSKEGRLVCLTHASYNEMGLVRHLEFEMAERTGTLPTDAEIAGASGLTERRVRVLRRAAKAPISLDIPVNEDDETVSLVDTLVDDSTPPDILGGLDRDTLVGTLSSLIADLSEVEQYIITHYFGWGGCEKMTQEEMSGVLGITRQAVSERLRMALSKMRRNPKARGLDVLL